MSEIFKDFINTAKSNKTRIYVITYLIINEILTKVSFSFACCGSSRLRHISRFSSILSALRFPALLNIIDTGIAGIYCNCKAAPEPTTHMPSSTPVIFYTRSLAIPDRKHWILAVRYSKGGLYANDLGNRNTTGTRMWWMLML